MPRTVSAGVVVTDGNSLLLCHVTGAKHWDLPKGKIDLGEEPITAAVRELREETGLIVDTVSLVDLGRFAYKKNKDLHLWLHMVEELPDTRSLDCLSMFDDGKGAMKKEMDGFANVKLDKIDSYVIPDMLAVLNRVKVLIQCG